MGKQTSYNDDHPEQYSDEIFVGNADKNDYADIKWKTKRKGDQAYDRYGNKIPRETGIRPVFINKIEFYRLGLL